MAVPTRIATVGLAWLVLTSSAAAHPGHGQGGGDFSALHYLIEPEHLLAGIPVLLLLVLGFVYFTRTPRAKARSRT